ncbi:MAG TPA: hypothetical protein VGH89_13440 [Pseudonocardia sp.]
MSQPARRFVIAGVVLLLALGTGLYLLYRSSPLSQGPPGCSAALGVTAGAGSDTVAEGMSEYPLSTEQADNAATIASVGATLGMPDRAITVALATALQESGLHNLDHGDRDSIGLFQQRPSQGWGSAGEIADPVYAARAFYRRLNKLPHWTRLDINDAAQAVQRSAVPDAYGQWEDQARTIAAALTGDPDASITCHDLRLGRPQSPLVLVARRELGTAALSGWQPGERGRQIGNWLVAHALRFGIDRVTVDGNTWTAESGAWSRGGPADGRLSLHQVGSPTS